MSRRNHRHSEVRPIYAFAISWVLLSLLLPMYRIWALVLSLLLCALVSYAVGKSIGKKRAAQEAKAAAEAPREEKPKTDVNPNKKSYGPEVDAILEEGNRALSEMGRIYSSIKDPEVRAKINEIMRITDKIAQDAIADPSDIPQIKKFMNYYLPTTIKLLNAYDRMSSQGIAGDNLDKSMKSINEMLDAAIEAYKKRLDSLFANQALDIETDIQVMNTMLAREGLSGDSDFDIKQ